MARPRSRVRFVQSSKNNKVYAPREEPHLLLGKEAVRGLSEAVKLTSSVSIYGGFACGSWAYDGSKPIV